MSEFSTARQKMVDGQVRPSDVTDLRILDAMLAVPREEFVPPAQRPIAYLDLDIEVGRGGNRETIPHQAGRSGKDDSGRHHRGDRSGVGGWLRHRLLGSASLPTLPAKCLPRNLMLRWRARPRRICLKLESRTSQSGTLRPAAGDAAHGPYDVIILDGATEIEPSTLCAQLKPDGRLVGVFAATQPPRAHLVARSAGDFGESHSFRRLSLQFCQGMQRLPAFTF